MRVKTLRKHVYSRVSVELRQEKAGDIRLISGLFLLNTLRGFYPVYNPMLYSAFFILKKKKNHVQLRFKNSFFPIYTAHHK